VGKPRLGETVGARLRDAASRMRILEGSAERESTHSNELALPTARVLLPLLQLERTTNGRWALPPHPKAAILLPAPERQDN
jgi:hypothetical protein